MRYYAIQDKQIDAATGRRAAAVPVVHEFPSKASRDEWVARGSRKGEPYRRTATPAEAEERKGAALRAPAPVRHLYEN